MKDSFLKKRRFFDSFILYFVISLFFICFCYISVYFGSFLSREADSNAYTPIYEISKGVMVESSNGITKRVDLPAKLASDHRYSYQFLAKKMDEEQALYLFIMGENLTFQLSYNDERIYDFQPIDTKLMASGGNFLRYIKIPEKYVDKELTIDFESAIKSSYGIQIPSLSLGSHSDLMMFHYFNEFGVFVISMFLFVFGVETMLIIVFIFFFREIKVRFLMISVFAFASGVYVLVHSPLVFMSIPKAAYLSAAELISLMEIPLFLVVFVLNIFNDDQRKVWQYQLGRMVAYLLIVNLLVQMLLTFTGISEFMQLLSITQALFILAFSYILLLLFTMKFKKKEEKWLLLTIILVGIVFISLILVFVFTASSLNLIFVGITCLIFIIYQVFFEIKIYKDKYKQFYKVNLYKGLALIDSLTELENRNAFERDFKDNQALINKRVLVMIIDINNLKQMNDHYGHKTGDLLIQSMADSIKLATKKFDKLKAYRIGGDEFAIVGSFANEVIGDQIKAFIEKEAHNISLKKVGIPLEFGVGYEVYTMDDQTDLTRCIHQVDEKMYLNKQEKKQTNN